jgi:hypothetical protein
MSNRESYTENFKDTNFRAELLENNTHPTTFKMTTR